jgi:hypothetical protein
MNPLHSIALSSTQATAAAEQEVRTHILNHASTENAWKIEAEDAKIVRGILSGNPIFRRGIKKNSSPSDMKRPSVSSPHQDHRDES